MGALYCSLCCISTYQLHCLERGSIIANQLIHLSVRGVDKSPYLKYIMVINYIEMEIYAWGDCLNENVDGLILPACRGIYCFNYHCVVYNI